MAKKQPKLEAIPVWKVRLSADNTIVGYVYRWNTGDVQIRWLGARRSLKEVYYEDFGNERG